MTPLLDEVGRAGLPVRLQVDGDRFPLPRGIDISAYRIVQEGLTNALKHAQRQPSRGRAPVRSRSAAGSRCSDDGGATAPGNALGHGLIGIHERVKLYGGEMATGTPTAAASLLSARLPLTGYR